MFKAYQVFVTGLTGSQQGEPTCGQGKPVSQQSNKTTPALWDPQLEMQYSTNTESWAETGELGRRKNPNNANGA